MTKTSKPSLAETHPELAAQADGWDPTTIIAGSKRKLQWRCDLGHKWEAIVSNRSNLKSGCPFCSGNKIMIGFNDLATTHPEIASQAVGWDPKTVSRGSQKKCLWRCKLGHEWQATVSDRTSQTPRGCGVCAGKQVLVGVTDLATTHPGLASQAVGWDPRTVSAGSSRSRLWRCELGHEWEAQIKGRVRGFGCAVCAGKQVLVGVTDLATTHPELAFQAVGWDPRTVSRGSGKKHLWRCELGHEWKSTVGNRARGEGCPICSRHRTLAGFNDLATTHPELALQAVGWDPRTVSSGSNKKHLWRCELGHEWKASVGNRANLDSGCPFCVGKQVMVGFNDLATTHPELALQADGWNPKEISFGSSKKKKWKCDQGHTFVQAVANRAGKQKQGCPSCANSGFDPNRLSFLYFIHNFDLQMLQIGITNDPNRRLFEHQKNGWELLELRGPMDGYLTRNLETDCLHALEKRGAILGHKAGIEKFDGYTEAWTKKSLNVTSIRQILDWVYEDEVQ